MCYYLTFVPGPLDGNYKLHLANVMLFSIESTEYSLCGTVLDAVNSIRDINDLTYNHHEQSRVLYHRQRF